MKKLLILAITLCSSLFTVDAADKKDLVDYVNPLVGSQSKISLSTGNTYPAIAMPWGMNFWKDGRRLGVHIRRGQDPWFQADSSAQPVDQRLRTVCHHAGCRCS